MSNKLQELTDRLLQDGVNKGNEEAEKLINQAKAEAQQIVDEANSAAQEIIKEAEKKSAELSKNTNSEIKLASSQALSALKQQITDLINNSVVNQSVSDTVNDKEVLKAILKSLFENWSANNTLDFNVILPEASKEEIVTLAKSNAKKLLDGGMEITSSANLSTGFQIVPKDGSYKLSFTDKDFQNFFKHFLRPQLGKFLFEEA